MSRHAPKDCHNPDRIRGGPCRRGVRRRERYAARAGHPVSAVTGQGGAGAQSVTDYLKYTGGKAGKADQSLPPVYIGWVNQQGGQVEIGRFATNGAELAIKYINEELGGVGGHPVQLKTCFIAAAEEEGTTCGQKLAADKMSR